MKKFLLLLILMLSVLATSSALAAKVKQTPIPETRGMEAKMVVTATASCKNKNHVGNDWVQYYWLDEEEFEKGKITAVFTEGKEFCLTTEVDELDKYPDVGYVNIYYTPTEQELKKGFTLTDTVDVVENRGRYSGNTATWTITFIFKPMK